MPILEGVPYFAPVGEMRGACVMRWMGVRAGVAATPVSPRGATGVYTHARYGRTVHGFRRGVSCSCDVITT